MGTTTYVDCFSYTGDPEDVVWNWYLQKGAYNYTTNTCIGNQECGAYTQIVWKNTTELGCSGGVGCHECGCPEGGNVSSYLFVCAYSPPGNIPGQRP